MNVFITGSSGFIGKQLLRHLVSDSRFKKIYCLCRKATVLPEKCIVLQGTLETLKDASPIEADVCIHLAGITNSVTSNDSDVFAVNSDGTASVIEFCKRSGIPRIVFLSSINVYLKEKYAYALSKLEAEEHIKKSGIDYSILRCSLVYGEGCSSFDKIFRFIRTFRAVPVLGNGEACEKPIYIDEVCRAVISHALKKGESRICDLCGKNEMSYNGMVKEMAAVINKRVFLLHLPVAPFKTVARFCYKHGIPFPIQPEQIAHMCEDLCGEINEDDCNCDYKLQDFSSNLRKYIPN